MRLTATMVVTGLMAAVLAAQPAATRPHPIRIIVNESNSVEELTRAEVSRFFLKKVTTWADGSPLEPVDLAERAAARELFSKSVLGKRVAAVKAYWQQMIFSGKAVPPPERKTEEEVLDYVLSRRGAIGYVSPGTEIRAGLKTVRVIDE